MATRLIEKFPVSNTTSINVYYESSNREYIVREMHGRTARAEADYFTDDKQDALVTAKAKAEELRAPKRNPAPKHFEDEDVELVRMSYGIIPARKVFDKHWDNFVGEDYYPIKWSRSDGESVADTVLDGDGDYDADDIYKGIGQLNRKSENGDDNAGSIASSILLTLGFEWI